MNDNATMGVAFAAGLLLGAFFFGGLWWTVLKGVRSKRPGILFSLSMLIRTGVALAGFILVSQGDFIRLVLCLIGFFIARSAVIRLTRKATGEEPPGNKEEPHAT